MSKSPTSLEARVSAASITPSTQRRIYVNLPAKKHAPYPANKIKTSKYTIFTFLPKNIYEQFQGLANFYFLAIVILQGFPEFSQVNIIVPTLPILIILLATAVKVTNYVILGRC
jgi:phospholipid-translocating ATPase